MADRFLLKKFASNTNDVGQFGSFQQGGGKIGDGVKTTDPNQIQASPAWEQGWGAATDYGLLLPRLEEMNGVQRVFAEMLWNQWRDGITFWQAGAPVKALQSVVIYQTGDELPKIYINKTGANGANPPPQDTDNWALAFDPTNTQLLSNMEQVVSAATNKYPSSAAVSAYAQATGNPVGTIIIWGADTAPAGYLICNGAAISRTTYANLFNVIGTIWGVGDGNTTFNLPNFENDIRLVQYYRNGTTAYLRYSNGVVDQWGFVERSAVNIAQGVTFAVPYVGNAYNSLATVDTFDIDGYNYFASTAQDDVTGAKLTVYTRGHAGTVSERKTHYRAVGLSNITQPQRHYCIRY